MRTFISTILIILSAGIARAQVSGQFEVVSLSGSIYGDPQLSTDAARASWSTACNAWKKETKELNKDNQMLSINCETPSCSYQDAGRTICSSIGSYQIKTAGVRVAPVNQAVVTPQSQVIVQSQPQPQVIYETVPAPRYGFVWMPGFWDWGYGHHRSWHYGYWRH